MAAFFSRPAFVAALLALALQPGAQAQDQTGPTPKVPLTASSVTGFIPTGWKQLAKAEGDMNADGRSDLALILAPADEPADSFSAAQADQQGERWLVLALRGADGTFTRSALTRELVLCQQCGGVFGDPFDSLTIARGSVDIHHYGGSNWRWALDEKFWFRDGHWRELGSTNTELFTLDASSRTSDVNLLTGEVEITLDKGQDGQVTKVSGTERFRELVAQPAAHTPAIDRPADWPSPPLHVSQGDKRATLLAVHHAHQLYVRAQAPWADKLVVLDEHDKPRTPTATATEKGLLMARYDVSKLEARTDERLQALRWTVQVSGQGTTVSTASPKAPGSIRLATHPNSTYLENFNYGDSPSSAYMPN